MNVNVEVSRSATQSGDIELEISERAIREHFKDTFDNAGCPVLGPDDELDIQEHILVYVSEQPRLRDNIHDAAENADFEWVTDEEWDVGDVGEVDPRDRSLRIFLRY